MWLGGGGKGGVNGAIEMVVNVTVDCPSSDRRENKVQAMVGYVFHGVMFMLAERSQNGQ